MELGAVSIQEAGFYEVTFHFFVSEDLAKSALHVKLDDVAVLTAI